MNMIRVGSVLSCYTSAFYIYIYREREIEIDR